MASPYVVPYSPYNPPPLWMGYPRSYWLVGFLVLALIVVVIVIVVISQKKKNKEKSGIEDGTHELIEESGEVTTVVVEGGEIVDLDQAEDSNLTNIAIDEDGNLTASGVPQER